MHMVRLIACCAALLLAAQPLEAQRARLRLDGVVRDDRTSAPLSNARVQLVSAWHQVTAEQLTDSLGSFTMPLPRMGAYRMRVLRDGYGEVNAEVRTETFVYVSVEVRMLPGGPLMAPLTYLARTQRMPAAALEGYYTRLRTGRGAYITRMHVEMVRPGYISDLIGTVPGVVVQRGGPENEHRTLLARRVADGARVPDCPLRVYVDGQPLPVAPPDGQPGSSQLDGSVDQSMVEGIEVYVDPAAVPAAFAAETADACGAVAIWTRPGQ